MQYIVKREKDMNQDEKLRLEIMRTLAAGRGENLRGNEFDFDFRKDSNFYKTVDFLLKRFNLSFKDKKYETLLWSEKELIWPNKELDIKEEVKKNEIVDNNTEVKSKNKEGSKKKEIDEEA